MVDTDRYDSTELSRDPADYLNGPTGNQANRGTGGTQRDGTVAVLKEDAEVRTTTTTAGPEGTGGSSSS